MSSLLNPILLRIGSTFLLLAVFFFNAQIPFLSTNAFAADYVAKTPRYVLLMTSFQEPKLKWWQKLWRKKNWTLEKELESEFKESLKDLVESKKIQLDFKHQVPQDKIIQTLEREDLLAVFYVSRGKTKPTIFSVPVGSQVEQTMVSDLFGNEVLSLFPFVHPNLRFLGLVGQNPSTQVGEQKLAGHYAHAPFLHLEAPAKVYLPQRGLKKSLALFKEKFNAGVWSKNPPISCPEKKGFLINVEREASPGQKLPGIRIMHRGVALGTLPEFQGEENNKSVQQATLYIKIFTPANVADLRITAHAEVKNEAQLGLLTIRSPHFEGNWNVFVDDQGQPVGKNVNTYRFEGQTVPLSGPVTYNIHKCTEQFAIP